MPYLEQQSCLPGVQARHGIELRQRISEFLRVAALHCACQILKYTKKQQIVTSSRCKLKTHHGVELRKRNGKILSIASIHGIRQLLHIQNALDVRHCS